MRSSGTRSHREQNDMAGVVPASSGGGPARQGASVTPADVGAGQDMLNAARHVIDEGHGRPAGPRLPVHLLIHADLCADFLPGPGVVGLA